MNRLYYGDNLDVLRNDKYFPDESVDLIYLDPPFNSNRSYNVLFKSKSGDAAQAQIEAFDDTWTWGQGTEHAYLELTVRGPQRVADALTAMRALLGPNDVLAYIVMMADRLVELHRVLKPTGSLYLHCDSTASHYLKVVLDAVFGLENYRNEVIWKRATTVKGNAGQGSKLWGRNTDTIFFYTKGPDYTFNQPFTEYSDRYKDTAYRHIEPESGRRYRLVSMVGPGGAAKGNPQYEVMGVTRYWRYSRQRMQELIDAGQVVQTGPGRVPHRKYYLDEGKGVPIQSLWEDIGNLQASSGERLGYPTQKPVALLERIIAASSNPGDVVLDPFCGCGTTIDAAQRLGRQWLGIDVTYLAVALIDGRLKDVHGTAVASTYEIVGIPRDIEGAEALFARNPFDFERWAVWMVDGTPNERQRGDKGSDGVIRFPTDNAGAAGRSIVSVKGGRTINPAMVRDLVGTVEQERADMGILVCLSPPTPGMQEVARRSGEYVWPWDGRRFPRVQIITIEELLAGKRPHMPTPYLPHTQAQRLINDRQLSLSL